MFKIVENNQKRIVVSCKIPPKKYAAEKDVHIDLSNVLSFVADQNVRLGSGRWAKTATLYNYTANPRLEEEFIFEKDIKKNTLTQEKKPDIVSSENKIETITKKRVRRSARKSSNTITSEQD